jgi:hypothetical protein
MGRAKDGIGGAVMKRRSNEMAERSSMPAFDENLGGRWRKGRDCPCLLDLHAFPPIVSSLQLVGGIFGLRDGRASKRA